MEKRLKEAGISTEQLGQHELVREIHRIQVWIQSLNGGWSSNTPPDDWKNPIPILENRCVELQAQYEQVQADMVSPVTHKRLVRNKVFFTNFNVLNLQGVTPTESRGEDPDTKIPNRREIPYFTGGSFPNLTSCRPPGGRGSGPQPHPLEHKALQRGIQSFYL